MEYSKFSEMVLVNVKNEHCWRLRAVETWARKLTSDVLAPKRIYLDEVLIVLKPTPLFVNEFTFIPPGEVGLLLFPYMCNNKYIFYFLIIFN